MDLNQDIIPQICFSIRAGLAGRGGREGGREGEGDKSEDRKLCCLKPGGELGELVELKLTVSVRHNAIFLWVVRLLTSLPGLPGLVITTPQWAV